MPTRIFLTLAVLMLAACSASSPLRETVTEAHAATPHSMQNARQMVLVTAPNWDSAQGELHRFEHTSEGWKEVGRGHAVSLGRNGVAWGLGLHPMPQPGLQKEEGDGRSPAGVFALTYAFGYAAPPSTILPYQTMTASHYCVDVADSPLYTRIVDTRQVGKKAAEGSTEPMRLDIHNNGDPRYALGVVVEHNPEAIPGKGSCIFMHLWRAAQETTAGCTAMPEPAMETLLEWLDPERYPVLVLLPESELTRLKSFWGLPDVGLIQ